MRVYTHTLSGVEVTVNFPEHRDELVGFDAFLAGGDKVLGLDTEATGLDPFTRDFQIRTVQFGNGREAWVLRVDLFRDAIVRALRSDRYFVAHNFTFDGLAIDRCLGVTLEELGPRVFDTRIFAHLLDPRAKSEGGIGLALKDLCSVYVDPDAPDTQRGLYEVFRRDYKATKETGWALIDIDHPIYVLYAGLDPILAKRLFVEFTPLIRDLGLDHLSQFEHHLQLLLAVMQRKGLRLDVPYTADLVGRLDDEAADHRRRAAIHGVANVNSTQQVSAALEAMGERLTERTPSGQLKVDNKVLLPLADLDKDWERIGVREPNPLADAVLRAKRATKWSKSYAQAFLDMRDENDRIHPTISGLQARTARMSVSRPPLQQLPSGDWTIRRAIIADPGMTIGASDYSAVEMRVLAALSDEPTMKQAILDGLDLHSFTAERVFGPDFTKQQRKVSKAVGFGKVYGGGVDTIQRQTGADRDAIKAAIAAYDKTFPGIKRYARKLQQRAEWGKKEVVTPAGRHLPLDRDRLYAATNYMVQSTARDLLAQAIVDCFDAGLGDHLLLPVHDELIVEAPSADIEEVMHEIGRLMNSDFMGVPIVSDPEVYGPTWGHGYGAPN